MKSMSIVLSLAGVIICGTIGGIAGWALVSAVGIDGVLGALAAALVAMVIAVAVWVAATSTWRLLTMRHGTRNG